MGRGLVFHVALIHSMSFVFTVWWFCNVWQNNWKDWWYPFQSLFSCHSYLLCIQYSPYRIASPLKHNQWRKQTLLWPSSSHTNWLRLWISLFVFTILLGFMLIWTSSLHPVLTNALLKCYFPSDPLTGQCQNWCQAEGILQCPIA